MNALMEMAFMSIKDGQQFRYKTTCLLIILMLFSVSRQSDKLEFYKSFVSVKFAVNFESKSPIFIGNK